MYITSENAHRLLQPKNIEECIKEADALYSKGYYDSNPETNKAYAEYLKGDKNDR